MRGDERGTALHPAPGGSGAATAQRHAAKDSRDQTGDPTLAGERSGANRKTCPDTGIRPPGNELVTRKFPLGRERLRADRPVELRGTQTAVTGPLRRPRKRVETNSESEKFKCTVQMPGETSTVFVFPFCTVHFSLITSHRPTPRTSCTGVRRGLSQEPGTRSQDSESGTLF